MKKRHLTLVLVLVLCIQLLCSCGKKEEGSNKIYVGVLCYDQSDTFISELTDSFRENLESQNTGATVTIKDAKGSQRDQNEQVKDLIDAGCNVLCVNLVDRTSPKEIVDMAIENNIPVIFFNREPVAEDMHHWDKLYYVGARAKESGVIEGEIVSKIIQEDPSADKNNDGKIQYVILEGEPEHQDAIVRTDSSVNIIKNSGIALEKLGCGIANWNRGQAHNRMQQIIGQYPTQVELVIANNDDMALGAIDAYKELNYSADSMPVFVGVDGTKAGLEAIKNGELAGTAYNDKEGQAAAMASLTSALVSGKGMDKIHFENGKCIYLPYFMVTKENVSNYCTE